MPEPAFAPPRLALALPPHPRLRRGLWALPLLLSLAFVAVVLAWLRASEQAELEEQRSELISDALTLEAQFSARIEREAVLLNQLAQTLERRGPVPQAFATAPEVQQGLHRLWVSITWLDAANRIVAHLPEQTPAPDARIVNTPSVGLSAHLQARLPSGGALVARYSPTEVLRQTVPWWLARKYDVRLVDSFGGVIAATCQACLANRRTARAWSRRWPTPTSNSVRAIASRPGTGVFR